MVVRGTHDKSQVIEEPDEVKVSRPVLKTNGSGDRFVEFNIQSHKKCGTLEKIVSISTFFPLFKFKI
jgi:hypothetical protein